MSPQVQVLEEITLVAPFGVRFWDVEYAAPAETGLSVVAYPDAFPELRTPAAWNGGGIYSFSGLPGLRRAENGAGDDAYWSANPPTIPYTMQVTDPQNRYVPFQLSALLPVRGLFGLFASPPLAVQTPDATWVPVFSTPARPVAGVTAVIRGDLQDPSGEGAAWAVVTAQASGAAPAIGIADDRGVISLSLPYPELRTTPVSSPLGQAALKLGDQSWPLEIRIFWTPRAMATEIPDLAALLQQGEAFAWRDTAQTATATTFTLQFGNDLILRSLDSASGRELPYLLVTAAGSPI
jgi:hypothetical protein